MCPSLGRPSLRLAQVVDSSPIGQTDNLVKVHLKVVGPHGSCRCLTLVERHPREAPAVAREVHITIVIGLYVCLHGQVTGQRVRLPVAVAWVHGNRDEACGVVVLQYGAHHFVASDSKVIERLVGVLLQLVA